MVDVELLKRKTTRNPQQTTDNRAYNLVGCYTIEKRIGVGAIIYPPLEDRIDPIQAGSVTCPTDRMKFHTRR